MLRAESRGHNSLRSDKCPLFSNAFFREPRGSQSPRNQAPESEGIPALGSGGSEKKNRRFRHTLGISGSFLFMRNNPVR